MPFVSSVDKEVTGFTHSTAVSRWLWSSLVYNEVTCVVTRVAPGRSSNGKKIGIEENH